MVIQVRPELETWPTYIPEPEPLQILRKMEDWFSDETHWTRGLLGPSYGPNCLAGGIMKFAGNRTYLYQKTIDALANQIAGTSELNNEGIVVRFNDASSINAVRGLIRKTIESY